MLGRWWDEPKWVVPASPLAAAWCICSVLSWKFSWIFIRCIPEPGRYIYLTSPYCSLYIAYRMVQQPQSFLRAVNFAQLQHVAIPRIFNGAKPAVTLRHLMRAQLGHELNPALFPVQNVAKHNWRCCAAQACIGVKDARVVVWQWGWFCDVSGEQGAVLWGFNLEQVTSGYNNCVYL